MPTPTGQTITHSVNTTVGSMFFASAGGGGSGPVNITGTAIRLANGGFSTNSGGNQVKFGAALDQLGAGTIGSAASFFMPAYVSAYSSITGVGSLTVIGDGVTTVRSASYSGPTTVRGVLRLGGYVDDITGVPPSFSSTNQADYTVTPTGTLAGYGTVGLAAGGKVTLAGGNIQPSNGEGIGLGDQDPGTLTINGDLVFGDGARYSCIFHVASGPGTPSFLDVNGTLDLRGVGDRFGSTFVSNPGTYLVAEYQNRLGSFDIGSSNLIYTSAENSGPGQIFMVVPEPAAAMCFFATFVAMSARRRMSIARP